METKIMENVPAKIVSIQTLDLSGHSTDYVEIDKAAEVIANAHFKLGKWAYIRNDHLDFHPTGRNDAKQFADDTSRITAILDRDPNPVVVLAPVLQGGSL